MESIDDLLRDSESNPSNIDLNGSTNELDRLEMQLDQLEAEWESKITDPNHDQHVDYYAVLNVSRTANEADIRAAYRRAAILFHPDRLAQQVQEGTPVPTERIEASQRAFQRIQTAYDVLNDVQLRSIYDVGGIEALRMGWQVGQVLKRPDEIRQALANAKEEAEQRRLAQILRTNGQLEVGFDATKLFESKWKPSEPEQVLVVVPDEEGKPLFFRVSQGVVDGALQRIDRNEIQVEENTKSFDEFVHNLREMATRARRGALTATSLLEEENAAEGNEEDEEDEEDQDSNETEEQQVHVTASESDDEDINPEPDDAADEDVMLPETSDSVKPVESINLIVEEANNNPEIEVMLAKGFLRLPADKRPSLAQARVEKWREHLLQRVPYLYRLAVMHSFERPLPGGASLKCSVHLGQSFAQRRQTMGRLDLSFATWLTSMTKIELMMMLGSVNGLGIALERQAEHTHLRLGTSLVHHPKSPIPLPGITLHGAHRLTPHSHLFFSVTSDYLSGNSITLGTKLQLEDDNSIKSSYEINSYEHVVSVDVRYHLSPRTVLTVKPALGTRDVHCTVKMTRHLSRHASTSLALKSGYSGVQVTWTLKVLQQVFVVPVILANGFSLKETLIGAIIPSIVATSLHRFVWEPRRRLRLLQRIEQFRSQKRQVLISRQREAQEALELMRDAVQRRQEEERQSGGLFIEEALYGCLNDTPLAPNDPQQPGVINVTLALQSQIFDSQLQLQATPKHQLLGFYDPCVGEQKELRVRYRFGGRLHQVTVADDAPLTLPLRAHIAE